MVAAGNNFVTSSATEVSTEIVVVVAIVVTGAFAKLAAAAKAAVRDSCWSVAMIVAMVAAVAIKTTECFWRIDQSTTGAAADTAGNHTSSCYTTATADLGRRTS